MIVPGRPAGPTPGGGNGGTGPTQQQKASEFNTPAHRCRSPLLTVCCSKRDWKPIFIRISIEEFYRNRNRTNATPFPVQSKMPRPKNDQAWNVKAEEYKAYKQRLAGNSNEKISHQLQCWAKRQKQLFHAGELDSKREAILRSLAFDFGASQEQLFADTLAKFKAFRDKHGHCNPTTADARELAKSKENLRAQYRKKKKGDNTRLTDDRVDALLKIGFIFDTRRTTHAPATAAAPALPRPLVLPADPPTVVAATASAAAPPSTPTSDAVVSLSMFERYMEANHGLQELQQKNLEQQQVTNKDYGKRIVGLEDGQEAQQLVNRQVSFEIGNLKGTQEKQGKNLTCLTEQVHELTATVEKMGLPSSPYGLDGLGVRLFPEPSSDSKPAANSGIPGESASTSAKPPAVVPTPAKAGRNAMVAVSPSPFHSHAIAPSRHNNLSPNAVTTPVASTAPRTDIFTNRSTTTSIGSSAVIPLDVRTNNPKKCRKVSHYLPSNLVKVINQYISGGLDTNELLRSGEELDAAVKFRVELLVKALNQLPIPAVFLCERPEHLSLTSPLSEIQEYYTLRNPKQVYRADKCTQERIREFVVSMENRLVWRDSAFFSTSLEQIFHGNQDINATTVTNKFTRCNTHITILNPKTGKLIAELANKSGTGEGEHEVLFVPSTPFRVISVEEDTSKEHNDAGKYAITLEEIAEWPTILLE